MTDEPDEEEEEVMTIEESPDPCPVCGKEFENILDMMLHVQGDDLIEQSGTIQNVDELPDDHPMKRDFEDE